MNAEDDEAPEEDALAEPLLDGQPAAKLTPRKVAPSSIAFVASVSGQLAARASTSEHATLSECICVAALLQTQSQCEHILAWQCRECLLPQFDHKQPLCQ